MGVAAQIFVGDGITAIANVLSIGQFLGDAACESARRQGKCLLDGREVAGEIGMFCLGSGENVGGAGSFAFLAGERGGGESGVAVVVVFVVVVVEVHGWCGWYFLFLYTLPVLSKHLGSRWCKFSRVESVDSPLSLSTLSLTDDAMQAPSHLSIRPHRPSTRTL